MFKSELSHQLGAFHAWKQAQLRLLKQVRPWLEQQGLYTAEARSAIERAVRALSDDHLTVAVAGEFSRGKTELINALFFADYGRRLLPTNAGRTTMCPTEILSHRGRPPELRLLPIETRHSELSLAALCDDPRYWEVRTLPLDDADALAERLQMLTEYKTVSAREAMQLGLPGDPHTDGQQTRIPRWRLAQINIPHPLLAQGLRILDTPGLNAIGSEPELTYEMLPAAHAVLFVLGADTGVTQSDLQIWEQYIQHPGQPPRPGVMVVLNKTDTLWDEMRTKRQITDTIVRQCRDAAQTLAVDHGQVFALSAQKALLARIKHKPDLEARSGVTGLERYLGEALLANRMNIIRYEHTVLVREALEKLENMVRARQERSMQQQQSLLDLAGRSDSAIAQMLAETQAEHDHYQEVVDAYRVGRCQFSEHAARLRSTLDQSTLDETLDEIRRTMTGAWTTPGLKQAMRRLFGDINGRMAAAAEQTQAMRRLLRTLYRRFEGERRTATTHPPMYSLIKHQVDLGLLEQEAEVFRKSARTTLTEQHFVTKRYFSTIVQRARQAIAAAYAEADDWSKTAMEPLFNEVKEYRDGLAEEIQHLRDAAESRRTVQQRLTRLKRDQARLQAQLASLGKVREMLVEPGLRPPAKASGQN
ncbi:MAG: dynamin family protein [Chromatiaceae bacterium]|nr:dynamin family protein [Gammaproteobacteria bacterium]MCP5313239.1 dynamin family protein [Chromatiaceae bacterium]